METLDQQTALRIITLFTGAIKGMAFYPPSHPAIRKPMQELHKVLDSVMISVPQLSWGILDGIMFCEEHLFIAPSTSIADLTNRMLEKEVGRILLYPGISFDDLQIFARIFSQKAVKFDDLAQQLQQEGVGTIRVVRLGEESFTKDNDDNDQETEDGDHLATYSKALDAIRAICRDIERGRIPNSAPVLKVVDRMVSITMQEPSALLGLTMIKDYDNYTFNHCVNVGILAMVLGASLGYDAMTIKDLGIAGQLHDIGKTMIPKDILNKPGKLSSTEFNEMKRHSELGSKIIRDMEGLAPHISQIVLGHHLNYNRSGYPEWARKLPFNQQVDIVAIADTYDAITTLRVYQHPINPKAALNEMQKLSGTLLDSELVNRFIEMMGPYPVGTMVRLDTNEVAVIFRPNPVDETAPMVRILIDEKGKRLSVPREQPLIEKDGSHYAEIVAVVDPLLKNIDVSQIIINGNY